MANAIPGHYSILCLDLGASADDIRKAHRRLALKWHPDKVADPSDEIAVKVATQQFQLLQAAYEVLSDPEKRARYDEHCRYQEQYSSEAPWKRSRQHKMPKSQPTASAHGWKPTEKSTINVPADVPSIMKAIYLLPVSGGTINVSPGFYEELVVVSKPLVRIIGSEKHPGQVVIRGQVVFRECAAGACLKGFVVRTACSGGAVDLKGVIGNVTIDSCEIINETSAGIIFEGCSGETTITDCIIHDCKYDGLGLHLLKGNTTHRGSLTILSSKFYSNGYDGLYLGDPRFSVLLQNCRVTNNMRHGVFLRGVELDVQDTVVSENGKEDFHREEFKNKKRPNESAPKARETMVANLPDGWRAFRTAEGLTYFYHMASGTTQWSHPSSQGDPSSEGGSVQELPPPECA